MNDGVKALLEGLAIGAVVLFVFFLMFKNMTVKDATLRTDKRLEPTSIEITAEGDTTFIYHLIQESDSVDFDVDVDIKKD